MATSKGTAIAAPQIFNSDPTEQILTKEVFAGNGLGGTAGAMLAGATGERHAAQQTYLDALRESNMMAQQLAKHEADQEVLKELIKSAAEQANAGIDPSTMIQSGMLYKNPADPNTVAPSALSRDLKRADAENKRAQANKAGKEGGPQTTMTQDVGPGGTPGDARIVTKGHDANQVAKILADQAAAYRAKQPGYTPPPPGSGPNANPTINDTRQQFKQSDSTRRLNENDQRYNR